MVTLKQVAAHADVSVQTVSNALNAPHRLHPDTLARVNRSIEILRYRPNRNARSLRTSSVELVGYCVPRPVGNHPHLVMDQFLHALCAAAETIGRHILLFTAPEGTAGMRVYDDLYARRLVDGFVLSQTQAHDPRHAWLAERDIPFVSFGRVWGDRRQPGSWVDVDGARGSESAVRHLAETGRRRIGFLGWSRSSALGEDRMAGWRRACREAGLPTTGLAVRCGRDSYDEGARGAEKLLAASVDGIVALSDVLALGALRAIAARGLRPGADVAVTGFDDTPLAAGASPPLTSLRQPIDEIATHLVQVLTDPPDEPVGRLFAPELVVRESSSPT